MTSNASIKLEFDKYGEFLPVRNTLAELRNYPTGKLKAGDMIKTSGSVVFNDGIGADWVWDPNSQAADDSATVIQPGQLPAGRWLKIVNSQGIVANTLGSATNVAPSQAAVKAVTDALNSKMAKLPITATEFGAKFDGQSDDTVALQNMINAGHAQGRPVLLPGGVALISAPLDIKGKNIVMSGVANSTTIRAHSTMAVMIDGYETGDSYYNPCRIENMTLDGATLVTDAIFKVRYRHHMELRTIWTLNSAPAATHFKVQDSWLCRYYNLRTAVGAVGFHAMGANHSSTWDGCDFNAVTSIHLLIDNQAAANDGNHALTFTGCSVEFSNRPNGERATGIRAKSGTSAYFNGGYFAEQVYGPGIVNEGYLTFTGCLMYFGSTFAGNSQIESFLVRPMGGKVFLKNCRFADEGSSGLQQLINVPDAAAGTYTGKVRIEDADIYTPVAAGTKIIKGDVLEYNSAPKNFVTSTGRGWSSLTFNGATKDADVLTGTDRVCKATNTSTGLISMFGAYKNADEIAYGTPAYLAITYRATQSVVLALTAGNGGAPDPTIDTLPSTGGQWWTYITVLPNIGTSTTGVQLYMNNPNTGAEIGVRYCSFSDARVSRNGGIGSSPSWLGHF